jgi:hypothetical protein
MGFPSLTLLQSLSHDKTSDMDYPRRAEGVDALLGITDLLNAGPRTTPGQPGSTAGQVMLAEYNVRWC